MSEPLNTSLKPVNGRRPKPTKTAGLLDIEKWALAHVPAEKRGSVLDIGIGTGRTIPDVASMFDRYLGIDVDLKELNATRASFPGYDLRRLDARSMTFDEKFDCVFFTFNGIDHIGIDDRRTFLSRVKSHLNPGGYFIYSTHNLGYKDVPRRMTSFYDKRLLSGKAAPLLIWNRVKHFRKQEADTAGGYAVVNDGAWQFSILVVYRDIETELSELRAAGLEIVAVRGHSKQSNTFDENDVWVYIIARAG